MIGNHLAKYFEHFKPWGHLNFFFSGIHNGGFWKILIFTKFAHSVKIEVLQISLYCIPLDPKFCVDQSSRKHQHLKGYLSRIVELFYNLLFPKSGGKILKNQHMCRAWFRSKGFALRRKEFVFGKSITHHYI